MSIAAEPRFGEEGFRSQTRKRAPDSRLPDPGLPETRFGSSAVAGDPAEANDAEDVFTLAPLVDKIAFGIARGLVVAVKELEQHIACETRKVSDTVERQLGALQINLQELYRFVAEQRSANVGVQDQLQQLAVAAESLRETDARQAVELAALRTEAREFSVSLGELDSRHSSDLEGLRTESRTFSRAVTERIDGTAAALQESEAKHATDMAAFRSEARSSWKSISERVDSLCGDVGVQQEDIVAVKTTLGSHCARIDALVERLDRQAEAVRLMHTNYSQREMELEQLVNGLARLRAFPTPLPTNGL